MFTNCSVYGLFAAIYWFLQMSYLCNASALYHRYCVVE